MATYTQLANGSKGEEVRKLQENLISKGYDVGDDGADGIYGANTESAVRKYQKDNGLGVDGIAGDNTLGSLYEGGTSSGVQSAMQKIEAQQSPGGYTSQWQAQLDAVINKIANREEFSYDLNGDALYQQYKDQFTREGKSAMEDTMAQAAALTGGYGSTYAQGVGQQAYEGYLDRLNDKVPELYQLALDSYNREGDELYDLYSLYADREDADYGRYRDTVEDKQWQTEFDEAKRQYDQQYALSVQKASSGGGSSGGRSSGGSGGSSSTKSKTDDYSDIGSNNSKYESNRVVQAFENTFKNSTDLSYQSNAAAIERHLNAGNITESQAEYLLDLLDEKCGR